MKSQPDLAAIRSNRRGLMYAAWVSLFCFAMPVTMVYANGTPDATGVVTCKVDYADGTSANVHYPVEFSLLDGTVVGRWGAGKDVGYDERAVGYTPGGGNFTLYVYSISDPNNPATFEKLYSETGSLDIKVDKKGKMKIDGKSFAVMDFSWVAGEWLSLAAECDWKLDGTFPAI